MRTIFLTSWEHTDLLSFFEQYSHSWQANEEKTLFLRVSEDGAGLCAIQIVAPTKPGPHRLFKVTPMPLNMTSEDTDTYFHEMVVGWTTYGRRMRMVELLQSELGTDPQTAYAMGVALSRAVEDPEPVPAEGLAYTPKLFGEQEALIRALPASSKTYYLAQGGYVNLSLKGGELVAQISVPSPKGGGYTHPLKGIVRHPFHPSAEEALHLFGWTETADLRRERYDSDPEHISETPEDPTEGRGLPDDPGTAGTGDSESGVQDDHVQHEPEQAPAVHGLPETVLLEVRGEPGCEETSSEAGTGVRNP